MSCFKASDEETDCPNLAFDRVYSWPGWNQLDRIIGGRGGYVDFCIPGEGAEDFVQCCIHFFCCSLNRYIELTRWIELP